MCGKRWDRKTKASLLNLEDKPNTREKIMNNKRKYMISMQKNGRNHGYSNYTIRREYGVGIHRRFYEGGRI